MRRVNVRFGFKPIDRFIIEDESHQMDFSAIKLMKRTTEEDVTCCYIMDKREVYNFWHYIVCHLRDWPLKTKVELLEHFTYASFK